VEEQRFFNRRDFLKTTAAAGGLAALGPLPACSRPGNARVPEGMHLIGPREGFSPQVGTLVSMLTWMRSVVVSTVQGLGQRELDYVHDAKANTIGALLLHLAALEVFYQVNTFTRRKTFNAAEKKRWQTALDLGEAGRQQIKGQDLAFYVEALQEVREYTLAEFRRRDDQWLAQVDPSFFDNQPTNNYCKWFHVCEHESNHNGQIKWLKSRFPF
jgi:Protein of unknown function (DUF664)/TAT (twin-arginine translocation) pathway signal sequence